MQMGQKSNNISSITIPQSQDQFDNKKHFYSKNNYISQTLPADNFKKNEYKYNTKNVDKKLDQNIPNRLSNQNHSFFVSKNERNSGKNFTPRSSYTYKQPESKILMINTEKWSSLSALHDEKVENMKIKTEKMYKKKDRDLKKKLLKKEEIIKKQLETRKNLLEQEKKKREEITKKKVDDVYKNLNEFKNKEEEKRLILEKETFDKCNLIIII